MNYRIGNGYDVHRLSNGEKLVLGGVPIPFSKGTLAHSDGDVLIHAICDALLGALALGDIGEHFPDSDPKWKGADSRIFLTKIAGLITSKGYRISNVDCTVVLELPKISVYKKEMRKNISEVLSIDIQQVSVKATTTEGLGKEGRGDAISAYSSVLLYSIP